jgi:hypothetical protein
MGLSWVELCDNCVRTIIGVDGWSLCTIIIAVFCSCGCLGRVVECGVVLGSDSTVTVCGWHAVVVLSARDQRLQLSWRPEG